MTRDSFSKHQTGAVLVISLFILVVITLIGITAINTTTLEEKMTGNMRDHDLAFQAAESALRDAEINLVENQVTDPFAAFPDGINGGNTTGLGSGLYGPTDQILGGQSLSSAASWGDNTTRQFLDGNNNNAIYTANTAPRSVIRRLPPQPGQTVSMSRGANKDAIFQVTARGEGGSNTSQVILRTRYLKNF
jgi:type IV pilus assembly protein PilX